MRCGRKGGERQTPPVPPEEWTPIPNGFIRIINRHTNAALRIFLWLGYCRYSAAVRAAYAGVLCEDEDRSSPFSEIVVQTQVAEPIAEETLREMEAVGYVAQTARGWLLRHWPVDDGE